MRTLAIVFAVLLVPAPLVSAQASAPAAPAAQGPAPVEAAAQAPSAPASQGQTAKPSPLEPQGYTYEAEGRRDPFISLVRGGEDSPGTPPGERPPGLAGMATAELALSGTIRGRTREWMAIVQGVDKKTYLAKAGDKLFDGEVRTVTADSMVILQNVNDPLSLQTQREVRKVLRQTEEAK
jgi:hypothetical protein